jgi:hypothetical protein
MSIFFEDFSNGLRISAPTVFDDFIKLSPLRLQYAARDRRIDQGIGGNARSLNLMYVFSLLLVQAAYLFIHCTSINATIEEI